MRVALLSGGTGGARLATGLAGVLPPEDLSIIANTADDEEFWSLLVSPDVDAILYRLAGVFNHATGFGVRDDTFHAQAMLGSLGEQTRFQLGDRDIGVHLLRAALLRRGLRLTEAVTHLARSFGIRASVIPMSDDPVRTRIQTDSGELSMQEWFVGDGCAPAIRGDAPRRYRFGPPFAGSRHGRDQRRGGDHRTLGSTAQHRPHPGGPRRHP